MHTEEGGGGGGGGRRWKEMKSKKGPCALSEYRHHGACRHARLPPRPRLSSGLSFCPSSGRNTPQRLTATSPTPKPEHAHRVQRRTKCTPSRSQRRAEHAGKALFADCSNAHGCVPSAPRSRTRFEGSSTHSTSVVRRRPPSSCTLHRSSLDASDSLPLAARHTAASHPSLGASLSLLRLSVPTTSNRHLGSCRTAAPHTGRVSVIHRLISFGLGAYTSLNSIYVDCPILTADQNPPNQIRRVVQAHPAAVQDWYVQAGQPSTQRPLHDRTTLPKPIQPSRGHRACQSQSPPRQN
ncbi:hypothetical protein OH76DRAFT_780889 [Lentinus brumalis]|uniref:Uncharacterized protein n=1 Tax=Lentinus brumalis TaxID=2498619 RepID=A0A371D4G5_9APHY|nr:hypothetical protein OH76DRAFT_780889 [Polyporus brumalis]